MTYAALAIAYALLARWLINAAGRAGDRRLDRQLQAIVTDWDQ